MKLFRKRPVPCEISRCPREASLRLSNGPDVVFTCYRHVSTFESRWGQVFVRGISK